MQIEAGQAYVRSDEENPVDFLQKLDDYCNGKLHGIVVALRLTDGTQRVGVVDQVVGGSGVTLETKTGDHVIAPGEIAAFMIAPETPLDLSDELRGSSQG